MPPTLARIFGRSPFASLLSHMAKVASCVQRMVPLFQALEKHDLASIERISEEISLLEHEADLVKNDIRNNLPSGLFLPIARASLLEILTLQDCIADAAENVGVLLTYGEIEIFPQVAEDFNRFLHKNLEAVEVAHRVIKEMHELLESSFGGAEAEKVRKMVEEVAFKEHEADLIQHDLLKKFFRIGDTIPHTKFYLWMKIIQEIGALSDTSENLANRVRMILEVKG